MQYCKVLNQIKSNQTQVILRHGYTKAINCMIANKLDDHFKNAYTTMERRKTYQKDKLYSYNA